ncbi:MAG TPA: hypothetical protein VLQ65_09855 [Saliniramus sp.]|nr:hypothetical protein [Saliniramus sp.]
MDADIIGNARLEAFAARTRASGRILYGDVCRLQRNVLSNGIETREQVRLLLDLDRAVPRADRAFGEFLVASVVSFVVWGERPTGRVDEDVADWLIDCLCSERLTRTGIAIAAEIAEEADNAPPALLALLERRRRVVHHEDAGRVPGGAGDGAVAQAA